MNWEKHPCEVNDKRQGEDAGQNTQDDRLCQERWMFSILCAVEHQHDGGGDRSVNEKDLGSDR